MIRRIILSLFGVCCIVGFLVTAFFSMTRLKNMRNEESSVIPYELDKYRYKHSSLNSMTNDMHIGEITTHHSIDEERKFFVDESGTEHLISQFGETEYHCTGTCYCDSLSERRTSTSQNAIRKGVTYLVAAVSLFVAYDKAKSYFDQRCEELISDDCSSMSSIYTEVESCEDVMLYTEDVMGGAAENVGTMKRKRKKGKGYVKKGKQSTFNCKGNCIVNNEIASKLSLFQKYMAWSDECSPWEIGDVLINAHDEDQAYRKFYLKLDKVCKETGPMKKFKTEDGKTYEMPLCRGIPVVTESKLKNHFMALMVSKRRLFGQIVCKLVRDRKE